MKAELITTSLHLLTPRRCCQQAYSNNLVDHHLILDLLPFLVRAFFAGRLPAPMSYGQAAILACLGLQQREVSDCEKGLKLPASQVLALFNKVPCSLMILSRRLGFRVGCCRESTKPAHAAHCRV